MRSPASTFAAVSVFVVFYLMTVFSLSWGTSALGFSREEFLKLQMIGVLFFALTIPLSAVLADRFGRYPTLVVSNLLMIAFAFSFESLFSAGDASSTLLFLSIGLGLMGLGYGPLGTILSELFPTAVRYTGSSLTFNLAGIFGASLAPYAATWLATHHGIGSVGYYLAGAAVLALIALLLTGETRQRQD